MLNIKTHLKAAIISVGLVQELSAKVIAALNVESLNNENE